MSDNRLKVLLVENDPVDREAIERFVRQAGLPYEIRSAAGIGEARGVLRQTSLDVALLDYDLGGATAFDMLDELGDVPCIIVTARGGEEVAGEAMRRGAYDYLVKDHDRAYLESLPSTIANVLARKRAERALRESESRYQDLFDNAPDMYFQLTEDGTVISVNVQGASQLGYAVDELVGQSVVRVVHPADVDTVLNQVSNVLDDPGTVHHIEFRKVRKDGSMLFVSESLSVQQEEGKAPIIRILCRDITPQKTAEERAQQLQERLARSERMESLGILAGGVAHDLNNILGPMVAYPDLLLDRFEESSDDYEIVKEIKRSAGRAAAVIRDLLTLARRGRYQLEPTDLNEVVESYLRSAGFAELQALYPNVEPLVRLKPDLPAFDGSSVNLVKVLMNLVINAFEAMPHGGTLHIDTRVQSASSTYMGYESIPRGDYVILEVSDTGSGIEAKDQERMFEPFFTKKKMGRSGSGLGLSVVYGVVKDHGGYIDVKSDVGKGTAIRISIPIRANMAVAEEVENLESILGNERILIVDDVAEQRTMAAKLLRDMGYHVDTAASGREAVKRLEEIRAEGDVTSPYAVVLLDMIMEEDFDGLDTYQRMIEFFPDQKCVIVSGYSETSRVKQAQSLGAGRYLPKPYTREELGKAVRGEIDR